jgi:hypothetical protein
LSQFIRIVSYSDDVSQWIQHSTGIHCPVIPHPPIFFQNRRFSDILEIYQSKIKSRAGRRIQVSLIGEVRDGKGFELVLSEFQNSEAIRNKVQLNLFLNPLPLMKTQNQNRTVMLLLIEQPKIIQKHKV